MKQSLRSYAISSAPILVSEHGGGRYGLLPSLSPRFLFDEEQSDRSAEERRRLERYFNDIYVLFLHKIAKFALEARVPPSETKRIKLLFDELLNTRALLEESDD